MTDSHPMIQPTSWQVSPNDLAGRIPSDRHRLYELIWSTSIAVTLVPPVVRHARWIAADTGAGAIVVATRTVNADMPGYYRIRQDWPVSPWPISEEEPLAGAYRVSGVSLVPRVLTLGRLIADMEAAGITTAATAAPTLTMLAQTADDSGSTTTGYLVLSAVESGFGVGLTEAGRAALASWQHAGLPCGAAGAQAVTVVVDAIVEGRLGTREGLQVVDLPPDISLEGLVTTIETLVVAWEGQNRDQSARAMRALGALPPKVPGLPPGMDPERFLPAEHPLRALRTEMERYLAAYDQFWWNRSPMQKSAARWQFLLNRQAETEALGVNLRENPAFSAVVRWLIALSPDRPWPDFGGP